MNEDKIIFEQKALDYLSDSVICNTSSYDKLKFHFDGWVFNVKTSPEYFLHSEYPNDSEIVYQINLQSDTTSEYWVNIFKPVFELTFKNCIIKTIKKKYPHKKNCYSLTVYQNRKIGPRNYVEITAVQGNRNGGYTFYFIMDDFGRVIKIKSWPFNI